MDERLLDEQPKELQENQESQEFSLVEATVQMEAADEEAVSSYELVRVRHRRINDKAVYSKELINKAKKAVKIIKGLVIAAGALAGILLVYGILALTVIENKQGALIGFFIILSLVLAIFIALIAMFIYAKIQLDRLKRLR